MVTYTEDGQYVPAIDIKATPKEKLAGNPRLQEIIKAINAKNDPSSATAQKSGAGLLQSPTLPASAVAPPSPTNTAPPGGLITATTSTGIPVHLNGTSKLAGLMNGHMLSLPNLSRSPVSGRAPLNMIISQINARLETESKGNASLTGHQMAAGDGILGCPPSVTANGMPTANVSSNGSIGSGSPLGSRPGSAENILSGMTPVSVQHKPALVAPSGINSGLPNQRFNMVSDSMFGLKGAAPGMHTMLSSLSPSLNLGHQGAVFSRTDLAHQGAHMLGRKEPTLSIDYGNGHSMLATAASHIPFSMYPTATLQGQPIYTSDRLQMAALPLQGQYGLSTSMGTPTLLAGTQLPQTAALALRPGAIKRAFPDATAAALDWDKRPKFY